MRVFKVKAFTRWAAKEGIGDDILWVALKELERGLIDADLGGHVVKKRVAVGGQGKRGGARTLLAYRTAERAFFVHGFAKNTRANISIVELKALKHLAKVLLSYTDQELAKAVIRGGLFEMQKVVDDE